MQQETSRLTPPFGLRYRLLTTEAKTLLSLVNRECGLPVAAELLQHLFSCKYDSVDDGFWETVDPGIREQIVSIAKANRFTKIGSMDLLQPV